jgi:hypothetical protein
VLDEQEVAKVLEQVVDEPREILTLVCKLLDEGEQPGGVAVDDEVGDAEERFLLDRAEELQHRLHRDLSVRRGGELVEQRDRVAEAAACAARNERERRVGHFELLAFCDSAQELRKLGEARPREEERLTARPNRRHHLRELRRAEDEDEMRGRLLDQLQERVEGGGRELVRLVEDVDLVAALDGLEDDVVADLTHVVNAALAGGVHLDHVERRARRDRPARVARLVRRRGRALLAVQ